MLEFIKVFKVKSGHCSACATTRFCIFAKNEAAQNSEAINKKEFFSTGKYISAFFYSGLGCPAGRDRIKINNKHYGDHKETALHIAARKDLLEAAKWMINEGADLGAKDKYGIT